MERKKIATESETFPISPISESFYKHMVALSTEGMVIQTNGKITFANQAIVEMMHMHDKQDVLGKSFTDFLSTAYRMSAIEQFFSLEKTGVQAIVIPEISMMCSDGAIVEIEIRAVSFQDAVVRTVHLVVHDRTRKNTLQRQIAQLAYHDPLTGLANRMTFELEMQRAIVLAKRQKEYVGILFVDIDYFKKINDVFGHAAGDLLLKETANRLLKCVRNTDIVARIGGDEFIVGLLGTIRVVDIVHVARKVLKAFEEPFIAAEHCLRITVSMGISLYPNDGEEVGHLLSNADLALYYAKAQGRNNFQICTPQLSKAAQTKLSMEAALRKAIKKNELQLLYQPRIDIQSRQVIAVEVLLRWTSLTGVISPLVFIPLAEETGLIGSLTEWVIETACQEIRQWQVNEVEPIKIAINISVKSVKEKNFLDILQSILEKTDTSPNLVELEITESVFLENTAYVFEFLSALKKLGIHILIDDFGTGYSSFSYLKQFPVERLKIDKSFIVDITSNLADAAIAQAIINMAHCLNIKVVAEGVETQEQLALLNQYHCDEIQGYYFCKPITAQELLLFLTGLT